MLGDLVWVRIFFLKPSGIFFSVGYFYAKYFLARMFFEISLQDIFFLKSPTHPSLKSNQESIT